MPTTENYITQAAGDARYQALGSLGSSTPAQVDAGDAGTAGVSSSAARQDHEHPVAITAAQLVPAAAIAAWTSYTPTLTQSGAVTKTVTYAKYWQLGKTVTVTGIVVCTGAGSAANAVAIGLPVTAAAAGFMVVGAGYIQDVSAGPLNYCGIAVLANTTTLQFANAQGAASGGLLGVAGFSAALASGDSISFSCTYEAA